MYAKIQFTAKIFAVYNKIAMLCKIFNVFKYLKTTMDYDVTNDYYC
mgnify:FL=1